MPKFQPRRTEYIPLRCPVCGTRFERTLHRVKERNARYCSPVCFSNASRVVKRPDRLELAEILAEVNNWCAVGEMFGVSDNAVRKWAKCYRLNLSAIDGRSPDRKVSVDEVLRTLPTQ